MLTPADTKESDAVDPSADETTNADAKVYLDKTFNEEDAVAFADLNKPETEG